MNIKYILRLALVAAGICSAQAASVTIANHSFETGAGVPAPGNWNNNAPEGWSVAGSVGMQADNPAPAGTDGTVFTFVQGDDSSLLQDIAGGAGSTTIAGDLFTLTVAAFNQNGSPSFDFDLTDFSGVSLIGGPQTVPVAGDWADYTVPGLVDTASSEVRLVLNANGGQIRFDNVRLDVQSVPEPGSTALLGLASLSLLLRRKRMR